MRLPNLVITLLNVFTLAGFGADAPPPSAPPVSLQPGAIIHLEFPELPPTFYAQSKKVPVVAQLSAQLPSNYTADGKFPVFLFLSGGNGGMADVAALKSLRATIGDKDYIVLSLPLFRSPGSTATIADFLPSPLPAEIPPMVAKLMNNFHNDFMVTSNDYPVLGPAYARMLKAFFDAVPNTDPSRSVVAGLSNGAHAIGAFLAAKDPVMLAHFNAFVMVEGGNPLIIKGREALTPELKNHRFLILYGEGSKDPAKAAKDPNPYRGICIAVLNQFIKDAAAANDDFTLVTMPDTGHEFPPRFKAVFKTWVLTGKAPS